MKALTLWQPYATLIAIEAKRYETRSWATVYRGPLVIHAAKRWTAEEKALCEQPSFCDRLQGVELPLGAALCVVDLVDVVPIESISRTMLSVDELAFGDYTDGRFAWRLDNVRVFDEPVKCKGFQGLWNFDNSLLEVHSD